MIKQTKNFLNLIDAFASPIQFTFRKSSKISTQIGGVFTIIIFTVFILLFILEAQDLWQKSNPVVYQSTINNNSTISLKDFPFKFIVYDAYNHPITNINQLLSVEAYISSANSEGFVTYSSNRGVVPCSQKLNQFSPQVQQLINDDMLAISYCIDFEESDSINGDIQIRNSRIFSLDLFKCNESSCLSQDEIKQALSGGYMIIQFNGITIENNNDYLNPMDSFSYELSINFSFFIFKQYEVNVGRSILQSDDGLIFSNTQNYNGMKVVSVIQDYADLQSASENGNQLIGFFVGWSQQQVIINRTYMKIPEVLGKTMGCYSIIFWLLSNLLIFYEKINFYFEIYQQILLKETKIKEIRKIVLPSQLQEPQTPQMPQSPYSQKDPDKNKVYSLSYSSFLWYSYMSLIKFSFTFYKDNVNFQLFQQINNFTNDLLSIEGLLKTIIITKNNQLNLNIIEQANCLEVEHENQSRINVRASKNFPQNSLFRKSFIQSSLSSPRISDQIKNENEEFKIN